MNKFSSEVTILKSQNVSKQKRKKLTNPLNNFPFHKKQRGGKFLKLPLALENLAHGFEPQARLATNNLLVINYLPAFEKK